MYFSKHTLREVLSKSFIDENGNLHLYETPTEKKAKLVGNVFRELPPLLCFLSISFFVLQLYIIFGGIYYHSQVPPTASEIRIYIFLFLFLGVGIAGCLKLGWFFMEQKNEEYNDIQEQYHKQ